MGSILRSDFLLLVSQQTSLSLVPLSSKCSDAHSDLIKCLWNVYKALLCVGCLLIQSSQQPPEVNTVVNVIGKNEENQEAEGFVCLKLHSGTLTQGSRRYYLLVGEFPGRNE